MSSVSLIKKIKTMCNRDCPDACGLIVSVQNGEAIAINGDPGHPVTKGFICHRTKNFLKRQYDPDRLTTPLIKKNGQHVPIGWEDAFDLIAEKLQQFKTESGPESIFYYSSGGSLGLLKKVTQHFFDHFGPVTTKEGSVCDGAGEDAQLTDFGICEAHDIEDIDHARHVINWGRNLYASYIHWVPRIKKIRERGVDVTTIDPVHTRSVDLSDHYIQLKPGGDIALAMATARLIFERNQVPKNNLVQLDNFESYKELCLSRSFESWSQEAGCSLSQCEHLANVLCNGPTTILVGWGLQRRVRGSQTVRAIDGLAALTGNIGVSGGGVHFSAARGFPFDELNVSKKQCSRKIQETLFGSQVLEAKDPPVRMIWVSCGNPVAMLPDSQRVAQAMATTEFTVVVDSFYTDTAKHATLILPTTTLLEDSDLIGSYGHHYVGVSQVVVEPPESIKTDLEIVQALAKRVNLEPELTGTVDQWKAKMIQRLSAQGLSLNVLNRGAKRHPLAEKVLFSNGRVKTSSGAVNLIHKLTDFDEAESNNFPLWLFSNSTRESQSSQWVSEMDYLPARIHPNAAPKTHDGQIVNLVSAIGSIQVKLIHDNDQREDVVIVPKGGHFEKGQSANSLIEARTTDFGGGASYLDTRVRVSS